MKTFMKRILCLGLILLLLLPCIVACKKNQKGDDESESVSDVVESVSDSETESETEVDTKVDSETESDTEEDTVADSETETETETETESETESNRYDVYDDLGEIDLGGRTVMIAQSGIEDYKNEICVERITGDVVNDAIFTRTKSVETRLNCNIENYTIGNGVYSVLTDLEAGILGGEVKYDIIHNPVYSTCAYTTRGLYRDINAVNNIDLDNAYWSEFVNEALEIGGAQYVASGAISLSFYKFTFVTAVNNTILATKAGAPDLAQVVESGEWTIEYQKNLTKEYYLDRGATGKDEEDDFGLVTTAMACVDPYVSSGEVTFLKKDGNGYYSWAFDLAHASSVMDKIVELYSAESTYCIPDGSLEAIADKFANSGTLMATLRLFELESASIRSMKDEYTILPIPRYSDDQDGYYSLISDRFTGVAIPVSVTDDDVEDIGAVIEAMASESFRTVTPAYYEIVLKTRYSDDASDWKMMEMIMQNVKMDAVLPYTAALELDSGKTIIKLWRSVASKSYVLGTTTELSSTFNESIGTEINEKLNGETGLQTYIKNQLASK